LKLVQQLRGHDHLNVLFGPGAEQAC
jgi:hypothetical protein